MAGRVVDAMASNLGLPAMSGEVAQSFACRTAYSALRFWMQAYCLDDGYGGAFGIGGDAVARKSTLWLRGFATVYPMVRRRFSLNGATESSPGMRGAIRTGHVRDMLADTGDLMATRDGTYRCAARHEVPVAGRWQAVVGLLDPTDDVAMRGVGPLSGLVCIADGTDDPDGAHPCVEPTVHAWGVRFEPIDQSYTRMILSSSVHKITDAHVRLWLEALTWPDWRDADARSAAGGDASQESVRGGGRSDGCGRIIRSEYVPLAVALLNGDRPV